MALLMSIAFVAGALACWLLLNRTRNNTALPSNAAEAFTVLARHGSTLVPKQGIACEIAASTGRLSIGDFIASYVQWSHGRDQRMQSSLTCEGDPLLSCVWVFGEAKASEGWGRFLHFQYDRRSQAIVPETLACIDVP